MRALLPVIYVLHLLKVLLRIALIQISLKDFVKMTRHWKIVRGPDVFYNLMSNE